MSVGTHVAGGQTINPNCYYGKAISPRQRCKLMCVPPLRLLQGTILEIVVQHTQAGASFAQQSSRTIILKKIILMKTFDAERPISPSRVSLMN